MDLLTVGQVARQLEESSGRAISPQRISNLFYARRLDNIRCPLVGRVRLIPRDYIPEVERLVCGGGDR